MSTELSNEQTVPRLPLESMPYHLAMVQYLQRHEAELWAWFSADRVQSENNEAVRLDLLKATYRIERGANPALYAALDETAKNLEIDAPVTFYQSPGIGALNASLAYMPGEAHIVFTGPVINNLTPKELQCVFAHELMHFALLDRWGEYLVATQLLAAMANDAQARPVHLASVRLMQLYTEVYCDLGAYKATGDLAATVSALVKIQTGTTEIAADSYMRQTDEIFARGHPRTEGVTHPETFVRARALKLWAEDPAAATLEISKVIEGPVSLEDLDLLGQQKVSATTRRLIAHFLQPAWLQTETLLAHARLFFDDFIPSAKPDDAIVRDMRNDGDKLQDYYCYILLDFSTADRDLEEAPLAAALLIADELNMGDQFRQLATKELNLRKRQIEKLSSEASAIVARAQEAAD